MSAVFLLFASVLIRVFWLKVKPDVHWICPVLMLALPFAAGGFHIATSAVLSVILAAALWEQIHKNRIVLFFMNRTCISVLLLFTAYCISPFWAADHGMAGFALPKFLPLVLFLLLMMQSEDHFAQQMLGLVPLCGCLMTVISAFTLCFPALQPYVTVNGRLAGFFQYPNSFAAFLLVGLIVHSFHIRCKSDFIVAFLLAAGIVLSGSKTVFVLMFLFICTATLLKREKRLIVHLGAALLCGLAAGLLADALSLLPSADRFTDIRATSGTFLVRLLYFKDVLPTIMAHPFGIGYLGFPAIEGSIQTGRYYITYLHNEFLQLLLDAGWVPALFMAVSLLSAVFSSKTPAMQRCILLAVLTHCMLDFDLQFCVFWMILLSCMDIRSGKKLCLTSRRIICIASAILAAVSLWLGCGDWLYRMGHPDLTLRITPFHTDALAYQMSVCQDFQQMDEMADRILALNPTHSLAFSAKANAAFSRGDIASMIGCKESAIQASRYTVEEYCDYFDKLYLAMQAYLQSGNLSNAAYCRSKLLEIPDMMAAVSRGTHFLADMTGDNSSLALPPEYASILKQLQ